MSFRLECLTPLLSPPLIESVPNSSYLSTLSPSPTLILSPVTLNWSPACIKKTSVTTSTHKTRRRIRKVHSLHCFSCSAHNYPPRLRPQHPIQSVCLYDRGDPGTYSTCSARHTSSAQVKRKKEISWEGGRRRKRAVE